MTTTTAYCGYSISHLREAGGEETLRFDAFITYLGKKVLYVYATGTEAATATSPSTNDGTSTSRS